MSVAFHYDIEQGTPEWHDLRLGRITASVVKELVTPGGKIAKSEKVRDRLYDLAAQRVTRRAEFYENEHMRRGHREEPLARFAYEKKTGNTVKECGFIDNGVVGYSPDGLVGDDGLIEIKSRIQKFQIATFIKDEVPPEYMMQLQTGLFVTGRKWIDFVQYSNGMPLFIKRVEPDLKLHELIKEATDSAEATIIQLVCDFMKQSEGAYQCPYIDHDEDSDEPW